MKPWYLIAIGLGAYAVALIVTAPATLVDAGLQRASDGQLRLAEAQGTVWSGSGQIEVRDASGQSGVAKSLTWRFLPETLLRGHLVCEVELDRSAKPFPVTVSLSGIHLADADISLPATVLGLAVPKLAPLDLTGDVLIRVPRMSVMRDGALDGTATVQWRDAASTLSPVSPLGNYEVRIDGDGRTIHAYLRTIDGTLRLEGQGSWTLGSNPAFLAMADVPPEHQQDLTPLLRLIAVERGEGRFELQLD
jgi:general secretion pathway protein N